MRNVKNSAASNLNYMARNLNLVARSFREMPTCFFAMHSMVFDLRNGGKCKALCGFRNGGANVCVHIRGRFLSQENLCCGARILRADLRLAREWS